VEYQINSHAPEKAKDVGFIAPSADIIGNVIMAADVSVWFQVVIRADTDKVTIGARSNIQDATVIHVDSGFPVSIGESVTIGHKVMLHGCTIGNGSLVGINAVVLNGATIGKHCIIGAGTLITEGTHIPDNSLVVGSPGKVIKSVSNEQVQRLMASAQHYVDASRQYKQKLSLANSRKDNSR
jgi:carbonic anhydrase/acetyltransferase-like protein (isoleucine patch superfamily)